MRVYSLQDVATRAFGSLMVIETEEAAKRAIADAALSEKSGMLWAHPEHFNLYFLGFFDTDRGVLTVENPAVLVANVGSLLPDKADA